MLFNGDKIYITSEWYYTIFRRKKRLIYSPCSLLKKKQRTLLHLIKEIYDLNLNTYETAKVHSGKKWILKMDINNFYDSVPENEIREFVKKVCSNDIENADYNSFFNLVTINGKLPTGAPTSCHIANACFEPINERIKLLCEKNKVTYSKYMDDLTFSSDTKCILNKIEHEVEIILNKNGYKLNRQKTRYISDNKRQEVLGLIVNGDSIRIPYALKKDIRAMIYNWFKYQNDESKTKYWVDKYELAGYIAYVKSVDKKYYMYLEKYLKKLAKRFKNK